MGRCCVIARREAPKQPRGPSARVRVSPLGCFAALAMTRQENKALYPLEGERVGSGGYPLIDHKRERVWIPAFAGKTVELRTASLRGAARQLKKAPFGPSGHFPQRGKICRS
jgi:hypothetical protein